MLTARLAFNRYSRLHCMLCTSRFFQVSLCEEHDSILVASSYSSSILFRYLVINTVACLASRLYHRIQILVTCVKNKSPFFQPIIHINIRSCGWCAVDVACHSYRVSRFLCHGGRCSEETTFFFFMTFDVATYR